MKVRIENFQSIERADLEVSGLTVVVGKSNIGKSALVRAIKGALRNAEGTDFVRKGTKHTEVELDDENGFHLIWRKGENVNDYEINSVPLTKVGRGAPEEIERAGFRDIIASTGKTKVAPQIADQFFPIFLLDKSGAVTAEVISDVSRLNVIQKATKDCKKDLRDSKATKKVREQDVEIAERRLGNFDGLDAAEKCVLRASEAAQEVQALEAEIEALKAYQERLEAIQSEIDALESVTEVAVPNFDEVSEMSEQVRELEVLQERMKMLADKVRPLKGALKDLDIPDLGDLEDLSAEVEDVAGYQKQKKTLDEEIKALEGRVRDAQKEIDSADKAIVIVMRDLGVCPTCDQEFGDESLAGHAH
jgi:DNA repair ATPase RecN